MGSLVESIEGIKLSLTVKPYVTHSTDAIRNLDINDRFCYFPDEQQLSISNSYSQKSCLIECRLRHLKQVCQCGPYYFNLLGTCSKFYSYATLRKNFCFYSLNTGNIVLLISDNAIPICNASQLKCVAEHNSGFSFIS